MTSHQAIALRRAFQRMWVAGTLGAFFSAFVRCIPLDAIWLQGHPAAIDIVDRLVRYDYLLWLLSYFFVTNLLNEAGPHPTTRDVLFDVVQSGASLAAAYFLGFIVPGMGVAPANHGGMVLVGGSAVLVIATMALVLFYRQSPRALNTIRWTGLALAVLMIGLGSMTLSPALTLGVALILQAGLWVALGFYIPLRLRSVTEAARL